MAWRLLALLPVALSQTAFQRINLDQLDREAENPDYLTLVYLYDLMSSRSHGLFTAFQRVAEHYEGAIKALAVDCGRDDEKCPPLLRESLPSIFAYVPHGYDEELGKSSIEEHEYAGILDQEHIRDFVEKHLVFLGDVVDSMSDSFFTAETKLNRVLFFSDKTDVPLLLYQWAGKHRGRLDFAIAFQNATAVCEHYNVTEFPALLAITKKGVVENYEGAMTASDVGEFLRRYSDPLKDKKKPLRKTPKKETEEKSFRDLDIRGVNSTIFNETLHSTANVVIALFAKTNATEIWNPLVQRYSQMVSFLEMNCSLPEEAEFAMKMGVKRFPAMRVFPVNRTKKSIELSFDEQSDIDEQILTHLSYKVEKLSDRGVKRFFEELRANRENGVLLITNQTVHFTFKIAASVPEFKQKYRFAQYSRHSKELQKELKATNFPTIIAISVGENKEFRFVEFTGNLEDFSLLKEFLKNLVVTESLEKPQPRLAIDRERVEELYSKSYQTICEKRGGICVVAMLKGSAYSAENEENNKIIRELQKRFKNDEDYHFGWFDGTCETELRDKFGAKESDLPSLGLYVPSRRKGALHTGPFTLESLQSFLVDSSQGKVKTTSLKDFQFLDRSCDGEGSKRIRHTEL